MTLFDNIELDEIFTVNSMWNNKILSHGRKWTRILFESYEKIKIKKTTKK